MRAVVVGAGPAGLAAAACPKESGAEVALVERTQAVGGAWRRPCDRLHLHTLKGRSALLGLPMPAR